MDEAPLGNGDDPEAQRLLRAREVFFTVRELGLSAREDAIDSACRGDQQLRDLVLMLIRGDQAPLRFEAVAGEIYAAAKKLGHPGVGADEPDRPASDPGGNQIGGYRLLERLGEGGFGVVFMAEQERPVRRRVALKIIKLGMDTRQVVARFEAERQALALMDHPNIAKVFDAGATETGRPYFVMELVKGLPITEYCDQRKLSIAERLTLVSQVCDALQHAHQRGVIHRDIKPSNVLVGTIEGGRPLPKIIDFGVAKATSARLTERTIFTELRQMIGTPEYMSPEQAGESVEDVDTRTDVYAVGVMLYELLTGSTPFDSKRLRSAAMSEMQRILREEDPPNPSACVATQLATMAAVAHKRSVPPAKLARTIAGELDWIVMKAMEKDRARRYASAGAMSADIQRYLTGGSVEAAPPGRLYLIRKFVQRNRGRVLAGLLLGVALVVGLMGTSLGFWNAERQRQAAVEAGARADASAKAARLAEASAQRNAYTASVMSASTAINTLQFSAARSFLDKAPESLRGWEWRVLSERLDASVRTLKTAARPAGQMHNQLTVDPDGRSYFTFDGVGDPCAQRWDIESGALLQSFAAPFASLSEGTSGMVRTPDGLRVVIYPAFLPPGSRAIPVDCWDVATGTRVWHRELAHGSQDQLRSLASSDAAALFVCERQRIRKFDLASGAVVAEVRAEQLVYPLACSPDGRMFSEVNDAVRERRVVVRDATTLAPMFVLDGHTGYVHRQEFSADSRWLGSAADDSTARVWDLGVDPPSMIVLAHPYRVSNIRFSADAARVATIALDRAVRVWDRASGRLLGTYASESLDPFMLAFSPEGGSVFGLERDGTLRSWDVRSEGTPVMRGHQSIVSSATWTGDDLGAIISSSWEGAEGSSGIVRVWDRETGEQFAICAGHPGDIVYAMAVSSDGRRAAVGITNRRSADEAGTSVPGLPRGRVEILNLSTGRVVMTPPMTHEVRWVSFADDDRSVMVAGGRMQVGFQISTFASDTGALSRARALDPKCSWIFGMTADRRAVALLPKVVDERARPADHTQTMLVLDAPTLETVREIHRMPEEQSCLAFNGAGTRFVTGGNDGTLRFFDARSGGLIAQTTATGMQVLVVAFSPDGARVASAGVDRNIRIWDAETAEQLAVFAGHEAHIGDLEWDPSGERLVSCSGDGTVRIWEPSPIRARVRAREARALAEMRVEPMVLKWFDELQDAEKVVARIVADATLDPLERRVARQTVLRLGLEARMANRGSDDPAKPR